MLSGRILITGGAGTLGTALLAQARREAWPAEFTVTGRSELRLAQLHARFPKVRTVIADVRDAEAMRLAVAGHDVVIHAAAMKRIPECEAQPAECYATNVQGSANVARACLLAGVRLAIAISTDKAAGAVTAYGASKLLMESVWRAQPEGETVFTAVRYGNVVASNGSVIPLWRQQAREGRVLTITDTRMTRFWMAPSDAVRLISYAADVGAPGTIWVPKMGALPVAELARIVCPGAKVAETGLRSTEKLHEDLVMSAEVAQESTGYFCIGRGETGHSYTSHGARRLSADEFGRMLAEAQELEHA